nr:pentapeptide repeat-containing protein [Rothia mucilaginosa]
MFAEVAVFNNVTFAKDADFTGATFAKGADFTGANFTKGVNFTGTTFTKGADFTGAIVDGKNFELSGGIIFEEALPEGEIKTPADKANSVLV